MITALFWLLVVVSVAITLWLLRGTQADPFGPPDLPDDALKVNEEKRR